MRKSLGVLNEKLYALTYYVNGCKFDITVLGRHEEIHAHAMRLGLIVEGPIIEAVPEAPEVPNAGA